jgi:hypothetical protein
MSLMPVIPAGAPTQGGQLEIREPQIQSQHQEQIFVHSIYVNFQREENLGFLLCASMVELKTQTFL